MKMTQICAWPQLYYLKKMLMTFYLVRHSKTDSKPEILLLAVHTRNRIQRDERNVRGIGHAHMLRKDNFLGIFKTFNKEKIYNCEDCQGSFGNMPELP